LIACASLRPDSDVAAEGDACAPGVCSETGGSDTEGADGEPPPRDAAAEGEADGAQSLPSTLSSRVVGYAWQQIPAKQVAFVGDDGHIHELSVGQGDASWVWRAQDVTMASNAPSPDNGYLDAYVSEGSRGKHIVFAIAGEIHDISLAPASGSQWTHSNLSALTGAPRALPWSVRGYASTPDDLRVVFATEDGNVHLLSSGAPPNDAWAHSDLTAITGAPIAARAAFLDGYATARTGDPLNTEQVVYQSSDGHIHELSRLIDASASGADGSWVHSDLTSLTGAAVAGSPRAHGYALDALYLRQVVYVGADRHVHELSVDRTSATAWKAVDLTLEAGVAETSASFIDAYACEQCAGKHVVYETVDGDVLDLYSGTTTDYRWTSADLSKATIAPAARPDSYLAGYFWSATRSWNQFVYATPDGHIHEIYGVVDSGQWGTADLTALTSAPPVP
jgi:hypothetical protein